MTKSETYRWEFKARFRRNAFGWRSQPAIQRIRQAVSEIKKKARGDLVLAADGAVILLERLSPALEKVDSSSGAIGTAVGRAIDDLAPIIAKAPADDATRAAWLERLWAALEADKMPYIETLGGFWGELCASKTVSSQWADRLMDRTRSALNPDGSFDRHFHGTSACLSALYESERYQDIVEILQGDTIWAYKRWAVKALTAMGKKSDALRYAESCRGPWTPNEDVDSMCEEILLSSGLVEEAYKRYGRRTVGSGTYLATFRAVSRKYPDKSASEILADLVEATPGKEAKWFAAAKEAGLYDEAVELAMRSPCDPKTLTRAARDFAEEQPAFALDAGLLALHWLVEGYGYEISSADVWAAYSTVIAIERNTHAVSQTKERVKKLVANERAGGFVTSVLGDELGL